MNGPEYDVAIVGFGPVGAMGAYLLADAGLRVVVVDREPDVVELPRAVNIDGEIIRAFQRLGLGEQAEALTQPPREKDEVAFTDSKREPYFVAVNAEVGHNGYRDIGFFDQPEFEHALRGWIREQGKVEQRLGHEATAIRQDADAVTLATRCVGDGTTGELRAAYVLGCDGASSFVREALGIEWQSLGYDQDWLVVDIVMKSAADLPLRTMQVCDPARLTTYVCVKDPNRRWEFQLQPGETRAEMLRPEKIASLLGDWLPAEHYTLRRSAVYQFHAATAVRWREGRIFLAGDAAHQTPPFLGQGLNAGFRDVVNLAWKLPLVMDGRCSDALLDSYAAERDPHARDLVDWAVAIGKLMEALAASEAGSETGDAGSLDVSSGYGQGRTAPPLHAGVIATEQVGTGSPTGYLLRQPTVRTPDGGERRLDELLGGGFAVLARSEADLAMSDASRAILERAGASLVTLDGLIATRGEFDRLFETHGAAIVRPDRYVFGVTGPETSLDTLVESLGRKLAFA